MWFQDRRADQYVIDTSRLIREGEVAACRAALQAVRPFVDRFQCDVPWDNSETWPQEVIGAASVLAPLPADAASNQTYRTTGWVSGFSDEVWRAFITFAPYAFDADAWAEDMGWLFSVSDEGTQLSVCVSQDQIQDMKRSIGDAELVRASDWGRRQKKEWRVRQNRR